MSQLLRKRYKARLNPSNAGQTLLTAASDLMNRGFRLQSIIDSTDPHTEADGCACPDCNDKLAQQLEADGVFIVRVRLVVPPNRNDLTADEMAELLAP